MLREGVIIGNLRYSYRSFPKISPPKISPGGLIARFFSDNKAHGLILGVKNHMYVQLQAHVWSERHLSLVIAYNLGMLH